MIVNIASEAAGSARSAAPCYAAAKAGVIGFTKAIARETARYGVRCNAVAPGPIDTPMLDGASARPARRPHPAGDDRRHAAWAGAGGPTRWPRPIAYLASDDASFVTGQTLAVSGGLSLW